MCASPRAQNAGATSESIDEEANSGIFIRCEQPDKIGGKTCAEVNIYDKRPDPSYGAGAIVNTAKVDPMPKAAGKWNTYDITAGAAFGRRPERTEERGRAGPSTSMRGRSPCTRAW